MSEDRNVAAVEMLLRHTLEEERAATQAVLSRIRALAKDLFVLRVAQTASLRARDALLEALPTHGTTIAPIPYMPSQHQAETLRHAAKVGPVFYGTLPGGPEIEAAIVTALEHGTALGSDRCPLLTLSPATKANDLPCPACSCSPCDNADDGYAAQVVGEAIWIETPDDDGYSLPLTRLGAQVALADPEARKVMVVDRHGVTWPSLGVYVSHAYLRGQRALHERAASKEEARS